MKLTHTIRTFAVAGSHLRARRTTGGVLELWGDDNLALARGLGYFHAHDRLVQMLLVRIVGQGRLCACLKDDETSLAIDIFMRQMNFVGLAKEESTRLNDRSRAFAQAYSDGVNHALRTCRRPLEFWLVGYRPEPWDVVDTLLTINLMSYVGLAQTQQDLEKFLIEAIHHGAPVDLLKKLFAPHLDGLTDEIIDLIRKLRIVDPVVPRLPAAVPAFSASNNWAIAPARSASGTALECHDPHLECNRLPAIWYEAILHETDDYHAGVTMPGLPGIIMGRSKRLSVGFTYGFMDMVDYFIEECQGGKFRRDDGWHSFRQRRETIWRKSGQAVEIVVHENERGTLECDPRRPEPEDGFYLCRAYAGRSGGPARSLDALAQMLRVDSVEESQKVLRDVSISCNWVIADRAGNIGYQQSGLLPCRRHSGLYPVPGWWTDRAWQGLVPGERLATLLNPPEGFIVTANDNWNQPGRPPAINACQGSYRAQRIAELIRARPKLTVEIMRAIQVDLVSVQARRFMALLQPLIPKTPAGAILENWDLRYDSRSHGATLFEAFYQKLLRRVFGAGLIGLEVWDLFARNTNLLGAYFQFFDEALLSDDDAWYAGRNRDDVFRELLEDVLAQPVEAIKRWGEQRRVLMQNIFFGGNLPRPISRLLRVDYGPIELPGGRGTIVQGQVFRTHGRLTSFAPSYRSVTDLGRDELHTVLAGGPSGTILSRLYTTDIHRWLNFEYKVLDCGDEATGPATTSDR